MKTVESAQTVLHGAKIWPLSIPAYHALGQAGLIPKNTELLYGVVYQRMSKAPIQCALVRRLLKTLGTVPMPGCIVRSEQPLICEDSEPEPDVSVVRGTEQDFWDEHPHTAELVIEVCVSGHDYDRSKLRAYAGAGIKEVWLILAPEKQIEVHSQPVDGRFVEKKTHSAGRVICGSLPQFELKVEEFFEK